MILVIKGKLIVKGDKLYKGEVLLGSFLKEGFSKWYFDVEMYLGLPIILGQETTEFIAAELKHREPKDQGPKDQIYWIIKRQLSFGPKYWGGDWGTKDHATRYTTEAKESLILNSQEEWVCVK
jgi:hypothetical protein